MMSVQLLESSEFLFPGIVLLYHFIAPLRHGVAKGRVVHQTETGIGKWLFAVADEAVLAVGEFRNGMRDE